MAPCVEYEKVNLRIEKGKELSRADFIRSLIAIHYERTTADLKSGAFRALGNAVEIVPVSENVIYRVEFVGNVIESITKIDPISRMILEEVPIYFLFPAKHFITDDEQSKRAFQSIKDELAERLKELTVAGKNLEAERLKRRTNYDLALIKEIGYCNGIENYSRHFSGKLPGEPPDTLLSYFPHKKDGSPDFLTIIDESHVTVPQLGAMHAGDASRKQSLVEFGFRLPSAKDNRPLKFDEFEKLIGQTVYTSATPGKYEMALSVPEKGGRTVEQIIRPTGLIDPDVSVRPILGGHKNNAAKTGNIEYKGQIFDFIAETEKVIKQGFRSIATTLTKKMAEDLSEYLKEKKIKAEYLHSDIGTIERIQILTDFRKGKFDCIVGVNLLREGLDLPEVALIGILDADKEGFLRSETALIQTIGRAARNVEGRVILYADNITGSMERAIGETNRRRAIQVAYNTKHGITPKTIVKKIHDITDQLQSEHQKTVKQLLSVDRKMYDNVKDLIKEKESQMEEAVKVLDFETAAIIRDEIAEIIKIENPKAKKPSRNKS